MLLGSKPKRYISLHIKREKERDETNRERELHCLESLKREKERGGRGHGCHKDLHFRHKGLQEASGSIFGAFREKDYLALA